MLDTLASFSISKSLGLSFEPPQVVYDDVLSEEEERNKIQQQSSLNESQSQNKKVYLDDMDNINLDEMYWKVLVTNANPPRLMYLQHSIVNPG